MRLGGGKGRDAEPMACISPWPLGYHALLCVQVVGYLQCGSMEDNALSEPHALAHSHSLPDGDVGAQLWEGT